MDVDSPGSTARLLSLNSDFATYSKHELQQMKLGVPPCSHPQNGEGNERYLSHGIY